MEIPNPRPVETLLDPASAEYGEMRDASTLSDQEKITIDRLYNRICEPEYQNEDLDGVLERIDEFKTKLDAVIDEGGYFDPSQAAGSQYSDDYYRNLKKYNAWSMRLQQLSEASEFNPFKAEVLTAEDYEEKVKADLLDSEVLARVSSAGSFAGESSEAAKKRLTFEVSATFDKAFAEKRLVEAKNPESETNESESYKRALERLDRAQGVYSVDKENKGVDGTPKAKWEGMPLTLARQIKQRKAAEAILENFIDGKQLSVEEARTVSEAQMLLVDPTAKEYFTTLISKAVETTAESLILDPASQKELRQAATKKAQELLELDSDRYKYLAGAKEELEIHIFDSIDYFQHLEVDPEFDVEKAVKEYNALKLIVAQLRSKELGKEFVPSRVKMLTVDKYTKFMTKQAFHYDNFVEEDTYKLRQAQNTEIHDPEQVLV